MKKNYSSKKIFGLNFKLSFLFLLGVLFINNSLVAQICSINALNDQTICQTDLLILGNAGSINETNAKTPQWTQIAGPTVVIVNPSSETTNILGVVGGNVYTFRLSAICIVDGLTTFDDVSVTVNTNTQANAGQNIEGCPGSYNLSGNAAATGLGETGQWTRISGPVVGIASPSSPTTSITLNTSLPGVTTLRWTISSASCSSFDDMTVTNYGGNPIVSAGPDQLNISECYGTTTSTTLSASVGGNGPQQIGTWSYVTGPSFPNFGSVNSNTSSVSNLIEGTYELRWTVSGPCVSGSDTVLLTVPAATQDVTNIGTGTITQSFCQGVTSTVLSGIAPLFAGETVQWIQTSGPTAGINIVSPNSPTTTITGLDGSSNYSFSYTLTAPPLGGLEECTETRNYDINYYNTPVSILLDGGNNNVILPVGASSGSVPIAFSGGSTFTFVKLSGPSPSPVPLFSVSSGNFVFSRLTEIGTYVVRVTRQTTGQIGTGCGTASDDINIIVSRNTAGTQMAANAGTPPNMSCNQVSTFLNGNNPLLTPVGDTNTYTGYWTQSGGPNQATIANVSLFNTGISNLIPGIYTFKWHISGGVSSTVSTDEVTVTVGANSNSQILSPAPAVCSGDVLFEAEPLGPGETGIWTQLDANPAVTFLDATSTLTYANLLPSTTYTFRWVVSNSLLSGCDYFTEVIVTTSSDLAPSPALAGADRCLGSAVTSVTMAADNSGFVATGTTGTWTLVSGPNTPGELISDPNNSTVTFTGLIPGLYTFEWTTSNLNPCVTTYSDTVNVFVSDPTIYSAGAISDVCTTSTTATVTMNAVDPSSIGLTGTWIQLDGNNTWSVDNINNYNAVFSGLVPGYYEFEWFVDKGGCATSSSIVSFNVNLQSSAAILNAPSDAICDVEYTSSIDLGANAAQAIINGFGTWSLYSGPNTPTITGINNPDLSVTGLVTGSYVFRWTSSSNNPYCLPSSPTFGDFTLTVSAPALAGSDQDLCNSTTVLLQGNQGGIGTWTLSSSTGGPAPGISTISGNTASATITPGFDYVFTYTLTAVTPCGQSADVNITNSAPPEVPNAGSDINHCLSLGASFNMAATALTIPSVGTWTQQSGPTTATISNVNLPNATISNLADGLYIFKWNSNNGGNCGDLSDFVTVHVYGVPTANIITTAGGACQFNTVLEATTPTFGIGTWTLTSTPALYTPGDMSIDSPNNPTTGISIVNPYTLALGSYQFTWTVTNGTCANAIATVTLNYNGVPPTTPDAGPNQNLCDVTSAIMGANIISPGTGTWSQIGNTPSVAVIGNLFNPRTTMSGLVAGTYQFMWTASNGGCSFSDTVEITIVNAAAPAYAGVDQSITQFDNLILAATNPAPLTGTWTFVSGPSTPGIINVNNPNTQITGTVPGIYEFTWTVQNSPCATTSDNVRITIRPIVDLSLSKSILSGAAPYFVGDEITYGVSVINNSGTYSGTGVSVTDDLPTGFSVVPGTISNGGVYNSISHRINWTGLAISAGGNLGLTYNVIVRPSGAYNNNAEIVASDNLDPNSTPNNGITTEDDYDEVTITPNPLVNISLDKSINNQTPLMGSNVIFTLTVSNSGPNSASNVQVTDYLPDGFTYVSDNPSVGSTAGDPTIVWTVGSLVNGATETLEITATVTTTGNYKNIAEVTNIGSVGNPEKDINSTPNNASTTEDDDDFVTPVPIPTADLALTKIVSNGTPNVGEIVTFTITVTNSGPSVATNISVLDYLPTGFSYDSTSSITGGTTYNNVTGSWVIPSLAVMGSAELQIDALVLPTGQYTNFAEIVGVDQADSDSEPGNNDITEDDRAAADIVPVNIADLITVKSVSAVSVSGISATNPNEGDTIKYVITVNNNGGPTAATGVALTDILPTGVTYVSHTVTTGAYNYASGVWTIGNVAVNATQTLEITVTVNAGTQGTSIVNTTTAATGDQTDPTNVGNDLTETIAVNAFPIAINDSSLLNPAGMVTIANITTANPTTPDSDSDGTLVASTINLIAPAGAVNLVNTGGDLVGFDILGEGTWAVTEAGVLTFTPCAGVSLPNCPAKFTANPTPIEYTIEDNAGNISNQATITITYVVIEPVAISDESLGNTPGNAVLVDVLIDNIVATGPGFDDVDSDADGTLDATTVGLIAPAGALNVVFNNGNIKSFNVAGQGNWSVDIVSGEITFTPLPTFKEDPTPIQYNIKDNDGNQSNNATVTIDYIPVATDDVSLGNTTGVNAVINVLANDTTGDIVDPASFVFYATTLPAGTVVSGIPGASGYEADVPNQGVWSYNGAGVLTFNPDPGFTSDPTDIQYTVRDLQGVSLMTPTTSLPATVHIDYNLESPVAIDDSLTGVPAGDVAIVTVFGNIGNDYDMDAAAGGVLVPTTIQIVGTAGPLTDLVVPNEGTWSIDITTTPLTPTINFTPLATFTSNPTPIKYTVKDNDNNVSNEATITVDYIVVPPITQNDVSNNGGIGHVPGTSADLDPTGNNGFGVDVDGDAAGGGTLDKTTVSLVTPAGALNTVVDSNGDVTSFDVPGEGNWSVNIVSGRIIFTPITTFNNDPTPIFYNIEDNDGNQSTNSTLVSGSNSSITIDYSPIATNDVNAVVGTVGLPVSINVTTNDLDGDIVDVSSVVLDAASVGGTLSAPGVVTLAGVGVWEVDNLGNVTFSPDGSYTQDPPLISYTIADDEGNVSDPATIAFDYAPIAVDNSEGPFSTDQTAIVPVLVNDITGDLVDPSTVSLVNPGSAINIVTDLNGDITSFEIPNEGTWNVNLTTGVITFDPFLTFNDDPTPVQYNVEDNQGNVSNNATVTLDYVPVATNDINSVVGTIGLPVSINVTTNDLDGDIVDVTTVVLDAASVGGTLSVPGVVTLAGVGVWEVDNLGNVTFTPDGSYTQDPPLISYTIADDEGNVSDPATIAFDYAPIAVANTSTGNPINSPVIVDVLANDITGDVVDPTTVSLVNPGSAINIVTDLNGDITSFEIPGQGTWNVNLTTGAITFAPFSGFITNPTPINYNVEDAQGNQSNNALVTIEFIPQADIEVTKTDNSATYTPGTNIVYTITVTNNGPAIATNVVVLDDITNATLEAVTTWTADNATSGTGDINENIATLNSGSSVVYTVTIAVPSSFTGTIVNTASATSDIADPDLTNNSSIDTNTENALAEIVLTKTVSVGPHNVGSNVTFTLTLTNNGPSDATGIDVLDQLPSGYTFVSATPSVGSYNSSTGLWAIASLTDTSVATLNVVATINATGNYTNVAEVTDADQPDPNGIVHGNQTPGEIDQADVTITPIPITNLYTTKTVDNATPNTGDIVKYTLTVVNNGPSVATGVSLVDNLPAGTSYVSHLATGGSVNTYSSGTWTIGTIDIGESATLTIDAVVTALGTLAQTPIVNTISSISVNETDPSPTIDDDSASITVTASNLVTVKTVDDNTPDEGQTIVYSIAVTNNGPSVATNVSLTDLLPAGVTYVSDNQSGAYNSGSGIWTIGTLGISATATLNITATVNVGTSGDVITNNTTVATGDQTDPTTVGDDLTEVITVNNDAAISLTKVVDNATPNTGDLVTYTITVTNNGPALVTNLVVNDVLPAGLTQGLVVPTTGTWSTPNWTIGSLAVGATETMTIEAVVTAAGTFVQTAIPNTATHTQDQTDSTPPSGNTAIITVTSTDLVTIKSVDDSTPEEGQTIVYSIAVTNYGPSNATGVSLVDLLPAGVTYVSDNQGGNYNSGDGNWTIGNLASGATITLEITATVDELTSGDTIVNTTTAASGDQTDPNTVGPVSGYPSGLPIDDLTETITVENLSDIVITKVVDNPTPNTGDLVTYTITVTNNGPAIVTNLVVNDVLPAGLTQGLVVPTTGTWSAPNWTIGSLAVGATETMTIEAVVTALGTLAQTPIINTATHTQDQIDSTLPSEASVNIVVTASDLVTVKTVSDSTPEEGDIIVYNIAVTNNGPSPATGVSLTDIIRGGVTFVSENQFGAYNSGSGIWTIGDIPVGSTITLIINAKVDAGTGGQSIVNHSTRAIGDQTDFTHVGDILTASITVQNIADIVLTKVVDNATPNIGDTVTYTVTVTNNGTAVVKNLVVKDALPTGLTFATVSPSDGVWNAPNWTIGTLTPGEKETIVIKAIVGMDQGGKTLINAVSNTQDQTDTNLTLDDLTATIVVTSSDLVTVKTVSDATPEEGDTIVYNIAVTNNGPSPATGVSLTDLLPDGVTYVGDNQNGAYNKGSGIWTIGAIANGATKVLSITVKVNVGTGGKTIVNNTTAAKGDQADPTIVGDDLSESIKVENIADIVLTKVVDNATPNAGDTVTYTVTVTNKGTAIVTNLVVKDALPVGLTYGTVSPSDGVWNAPNWTIGTLTPGEKETIVIKAIVGMDQGGKTLTNVVANTQDQVDTNLTPDSNSAKIVVTNSDLSTDKTVSNKTPNEGDTITYTIVVKNNGGSNATNVSLIDNLPVGVTYVSNSATSGTYNYGSGLWTVGNLANGASATLTITATVNAGTLGKTITNTTSAVKADQSDSTPGNNVGSVAIVPTAFIDLSLTKTVVDDVVNPQVGDIVTFEIRVNNAGPTKATGVQVTDLIPSGYDFINYSSSIGTYNPKTGLWSIGVIEVGNPAILLVDVKVLGTGVYSNCAEVTKANEIDVDSTPANGKATEDDYACASAAPNQSVDLAIVKTVVANNVKPMVNTQVSFEIRLTNKGNIDATEVIAKDLLPSGYRFVNYSSSRGTYDFATGIWTVGKIVNGETEILVVDAIVKESGDYLNCATITSLRQVDINAANNTSCIATTPIQVADLELTKDVDNYEPYAESNVVFTITLTNNGPSKGTGIVVKDKLPSGYNFVSATASVGTYDATSGLWNVGTVAINGTQTLKVTAYVLPIGEWENVAEVTAANELDLDSTPGNNDKYEDDYASAITEPIILVTMPESFSPNGDGINEVFEIEHLQVLYPNFSMEIVDRYGNLVYTYKHNGNASVTPKWWDGFSNGKLNFNNEMLPAGTYFYTIYFNNNERKPQTGWIYLRR